MTHPDFNADTVPTPLAPVDPQLKIFLQRMAADAAGFPRRDTVSLAQGRDIAEQVRAPWAQGGPVMERSEERQIPTRHGEVRARVHYPRDRRMPGLVLYIHGGGFALLSIDTHDRIMREYAERAGIVVMGIDYTRAPEGKFPQPVDECVDTVHWIKAHAEELGVDAGQLFMGGDSAGANLTLGTCITFRDAGLQPVAGMVLNYGGYGDDVSSASVIRYGTGEYGLSLHMMTWFRTLYVDPQRADPRVTPLEARLEHLPPACMVITECDPLYDKNMLMAERLQLAGVALQAKVYPGSVHSFLEAVSISDLAVQAFDDTAAWLHARAGQA